MFIQLIENTKTSSVATKLTDYEQNLLLTQIFHSALTLNAIK